MVAVFVDTKHLMGIWYIAVMKAIVIINNQEIVVEQR